MTRLRMLSFLLICLALVGCGHDRNALATTASPLALSNVVLYRNGVGYFERHGVIDGDTLTLKVRKDQINDLLKSLTVIDRGTGKALSVSIPLDPTVWQDAALAMLSPGNGRLSSILDTLRGTAVKVETSSRTVEGRIVMVEQMNAPEPPRPYQDGKIAPEPERFEDYKLTLLDGDTLEVVRLSQVQNVTLRDGDLAMQLNRRLDATAGEGMFQQVDVVVRLTSSGSHDLAVSYVAPAPLWKPTYRLVLSEDASGKALLQAWAVVSNVSGENWNDVALGLTSGAPLAFRYDLHTPEQVERPDLTTSGVHKRAQVSFGETTYAEQDAPQAAAAPRPQPSAPASEAEYGPSSDEDVMAELGAQREESKSMGTRSRRASKPAGKAGAGGMAGGMDDMMAPAAPTPPMVSMDALAQSMAPNTSSKRVAGLTRFDLGDKVTLPDGSASMVALINQKVSGEETFLYKPGGGGQGYEQNPYRVVRFRNDTEFALEPGPIAIYSGGSFVGEGLSETIASHDMATIPFAVEPSILVRSHSEYAGNEHMKLVRLVRGVLEVESFAQVTTTWSVETRPNDKPMRVLVRQSRAGDGFTLVDPPKETETLPDGYFVPMIVPAKQAKLELKVVERSPSRIQLTIWDEQAPELLKQLLELPNLDAATRAALQPIVDARQAIGRIDTELNGLSSQQVQLDERAEQERENLRAIQKDPRAAALRKRLSDRLEELTKQAAEIGRKIVELNSQRMEKKILLEDTLRDLDLDGSKAASAGLAK
jgi:hypothetical protein